MSGSDLSPSFEFFAFLHFFFVLFVANVCLRFGT